MYVQDETPPNSVHTLPCPLMDFALGFSYSTFLWKRVTKGLRVTMTHEHQKWTMEKWKKVFRSFG